VGKPVCGASSSLLAAQQRLESLRIKRRAERIAEGLPVVTDEYGRINYLTSSCSSQPIIRHPSSVIREQLPEHLGWESATVTAVLRKNKPASRQVASGKWQVDSLPTPKPKSKSTRPATVKLFPDIALGMLRQEMAAAGRIWLLLGYIDNVGRGWLTFEAVKEQLTGKKSGLRVCGWRQLRNLLNEGEGVFWERGNGRIWLRSAAKVAAALGIQRLKLQPVALAVSALLEGIGQVRAHLYASFHSSRGKGDTEASPIARETLTRISRVPQRTQRFYEQRANVKTKRNFAIGPAASDLESETLTWRHGAAVFQLNDPDGWHGRKNRTYLAWQLPNNYTGPHAKQPRGRMKRINQELADLFMKGMTGNSEELVEDKKLSKRFFGNGRLAVKAFNRSASRDVYWKRVGGLRQEFGEFSRTAQPANYQLWYVLSKGKAL
jgi:hypothetical protein